MSEETKIDTPELEEQVIATDVPNPFSDESWDTEPVNKGETSTEVIDTVSTQKVEKEPDEEILDPKEWLKREFDTDDITILKAEREEYKKLKEINAPEIKFADEQSKQIHELIRDGKKKEVVQFLEMQEKLETLSTVEVNSDNAADIIKLGLKLRYKDLTPQQIEYKYNKQFSPPKQPVQQDIELDEDFEQRVSEWKTQVEEFEMEKIIEAKLVKPDIAKANTELILPEIQRKETKSEKKEPTQEDLDAFQKDKDSFLQSAQQSINGFNGFSLNVKDKDVDYTVSYAPSQEEKTFVTDKLKEFAESGFDTNAILAERWVTKEGKMNVEQMVKDISLLYGDDKISQKLVTDSANKRIEAYLKDKKQINLNEGDSNGKLNLEKDNKNEAVQLQEFFWSQS